MKQNAKKAAALRYDPQQDSAPVLTAYGEGFLADRIVSAAQESGVPVKPDASLVDMLARVSVGDEIPEELYEVVAKILLFISEMDGTYRSK
ncbi:MAG: EscU/YscU/HrcU family type III secretion system export apparatus switch protein [Oscillospiraceae bacterium]|jgi:flagellar biosynthesis protein|nr:EscU/YscU/HrcU family type III secretion system export apparatus switch protein [Oscillospiraceae bacterium]